MSTTEKPRLAGFGLPTTENNPILQRQREFGSKSDSTGMKLKRPFVEDEKPVEEKVEAPVQAQIQETEKITRPVERASEAAPAPSFTHQPARTQITMELTDEQLMALAKERGLEFQPKKTKFIKHTYSVTEYNHEMIPKISTATGITIQELMKEGMDHIISKYYASYEYSLKAPTPKKR